MVSASVNCLLVHPKFSGQSFWNYKVTCELMDAAYPAAPLGMVTVAALLPQEWNFKLIDHNVEDLTDEDICWADIVVSGGMLPQQPQHLELIKRVKRLKKIHVVGGPDATSSPHIYKEADHLILGEAEITMPPFLEDLKNKRAKRSYFPGENKCDMTLCPIPRFDLLKFDRYLHVGMQFSRGCPFNCEFCDIIELFGRTPRYKTAEQFFKELDTLYNCGYRGHIDIVDDNLIANRKYVKDFLPQLKKWLIDHDWPFEFSAETSINLSDDDKLMSLMKEVGFCSTFVGIETPDEDSLKSTQKGQNTKRSIPESIHKIVKSGMIVNAGYILGLDSEKDNIADQVIEMIEETSIPANMVGLLFALPNTQLTVRLRKEGRLEEDFEVAGEAIGDQCVSGLNFKTKRKKEEIYRDYLKIIKEVYAPENYFKRVEGFALMMDCSLKRLKIPLLTQLNDFGVFLNIVWKMGIKASYRQHFWRVTLICLMKNPKALRYVVALMALYLHFGTFKDFILKEVAQKEGEAASITANSINSNGQVNLMEAPALEDSVPPVL